MDFTNEYIKGGLTTKYRMSNLPLFTEYEIRIAAYNKAGIGVWSAIHNVETMQGSKWNNSYRFINPFDST